MPDMGEKPRISLEEGLIPSENEDFWTVDLTIHPGTHYSVSVGRDGISRIVIYERRLSEISIAPADLTRLPAPIDEEVE